MSLIPRLTLLALLCTPSAAFAVIEDCTHDVSFNNGNTTKNLTAQVECTQRDKPQIKTRSVGFKNGKRHGKTTRYDGYLSGTRNPKNKVIAIEHYQDGKKHGKFMRYDKDSGALEKDSIYKNDLEQRTVSYSRRGGKTISFHRKHDLGNFSQKVGSISYNKANQLSNKSCPSKTSGIAELDKACGFGAGTQTAKLHNAQGQVVAATTRKNGQVQETKEFYPSGKIRVIRARNSIKFFYENGNLREEMLNSANQTQMLTEYYENGKKKNYNHTVKKRLKTSRGWYMNGKTEYLVARQGDSERMAVKSYFGNGRVYADYIYVPKDKYSMFFSSFYRTAKIIGNSRLYHENGKLREDIRRDNKGVVQLERIYYESGKPKKTIQLHADKTKTIKNYNKDGSIKDAGIYYSDGSIKQKL
jgi:antitoxin component YwqK of YwqJK toxin-antitoxin module